MLAILTFFFISTPLSAQEDFGQDPLYSASIRADIEGIKKALAEGADINRQSDNGYTALMWASTYSKRAPYDEMAKFLINAGADVNAVTADGKTPLSLAGSSDPEITGILKAAGTK